MCARAVVTEEGNRTDAAVGPRTETVWFNRCVKSGVHFNDGLGILCINRTAGRWLANGTRRRLCGMHSSRQ